MTNDEETCPGGLACPGELRQYFDDGTIDAYERVLSEGKEAVVHVVSKKEGGEKKLYAAKVYKKREERGFRNRADYALTQHVFKRRELAAIRKKSRFGLAAAEGVWQHREIAYLAELAAAGADVPAIVSAGSGSFVMEYLGEGEDRALKLAETGRDLPDPARVLERLLWNVETFLRLNIVHGDLSPYNVLYFRGRVTVIDFPQASDARVNPNAPELLLRDLENVCGFFARRGIRSDPQALRDGLWERFEGNML
jgi:RIO kinase 1